LLNEEEEINGTEVQGVVYLILKTGFLKDIVKG